MPDERGGKAMLPLVLASASPRRATLLALITSRFDIRPSRITEQHFPTLSPLRSAVLVAGEKADAVAPSSRSRLVIGADTIVVEGGEILGKPGSRQEAFTILQRLSGRSHDVITGVALRCLDAGVEREFAVSTRVSFRTLDEAEIQRYVDTGEADDKAGAYGIQGRAAVFVERVEGDYPNVVGLPLTSLYLQLRDLGVVS